MERDVTNLRFLLLHYWSSSGLSRFAYCSFHPSNLSEQYIVASKSSGEDELYFDSVLVWLRSLVQTTSKSDPCTNEQCSSFVPFLHLFLVSFCRWSSVARMIEQNLNCAFSVWNNTSLLSEGPTISLCSVEDSILDTSSLAIPGIGAGMASLLAGTTVSGLSKTRFSTFVTTFPDVLPGSTDS